MAFIDFFKRILPTSFLNERFLSAMGVYNAVATQFDDLKAAILDVQDQMFIDSATWQLPVYEAEFAIKLVDTSSTEARRGSVMAMSRGGQGTTPAAIKTVLESYGYEVDTVEDYPNYIITIKFTDVRGIPSNIGDLQALMGRMIPAHLELKWQYIYTQYRELTSYTHQQMSLFTYEYLKTQLPE